MLELWYEILIIPQTKTRRLYRLKHLFSNAQPCNRHKLQCYFCAQVHIMPVYLLTTRPWMMCSWHGLKTQSQCLLCEQLFKLNWYFWCTALSERSGRRKAEVLNQIEAHCSLLVPQVKSHCSLVLKAIVAAERLELDAWNQPVGQKSPCSLSV